MDTGDPLGGGVSKNLIDDINLMIASLRGIVMGEYYKYVKINKNSTSLFSSYVCRLLECQSCHHHHPPMAAPHKGGPFLCSRHRTQVLLLSPRDRQNSLH